MLVRMRHEDVHFEKKKFLTNSGRKKSAPSQRDPPEKIVLAKFLHQNDSKRLYVVSLHCWRCPEERDKVLGRRHEVTELLRHNRGLLPRC